MPDENKVNPFPPEILEAKKKQRKRLEDMEAERKAELDAERQRIADLRRKNKECTEGEPFHPA